MNVAEFRRQMPVCRRWAYFDHAAVAPLPQPTREIIQRWADEACQEGDTRWPQWSAAVEDTRRRAAALIGASPDEIAFVANTTSAITIVAETFPWREGDNVVLPAQEFPSNVYPWMNLAGRGVEVRRVPIDRQRSWTEQLAGACDERTRLLAISWVGYADGWRVDLDELVSFAEARHVRVLLDAIQGLGVFPIDVSHYPIDYLAADGHKWLLGPEGAGILFIRCERLAELRPIGVGWHSVVHAHDYSRIEWNLRFDAARYEGGSANTVGLLALGASLELLTSFGLSSRQSPLAGHVLEVTDELARRIRHAGGQPLGPWPERHRSGILAFELPGVPEKMARRMFLDQGVVLSCRNGRLRLSPHAYCDQEDVQRFVEALDHVVRQRS